MMLLSILSISFSSILKNKKRSLLTIFSISIGISLIISIYALGNGAKKSLNEILDIDSRKTNSSVIFVKSPYYNGYLHRYFSIEDINNIKKIKNVKSVHLKDDKKSNVIPIINNNQTIETTVKLIKENDKNFRKMSQYDYINQNKVVIVNKDFIKNNLDNDFFLKKYINISGEYFKIINHDKQWNLNEDIVIQESTFKKYFSMYQQKQQLDISYNNINEKMKTNKMIADYFKNYGINKNYGEYVIKNPEDLMNMVNNIINFITNFIAMISSISLIIAGIGVMNMMYTSVLERIEEIAIRRSCGATKFHIQLQFLLESAVITIIGGVIGILLGYIISYIISLFLPFTPIIYLQDILLTIIISIIIGILFGWYPAKNASQKELIKIIR